MENDGNHDPQLSTVLIVDDDKSVCLVTKKMLESLNFAVLVAYDGAEGVETYMKAQDQICLVLLDITMPRMNGYEVFKALRKISVNLPIVLSSGHNEKDVTDDFADFKPDAFLQKPYFREQLKDTIQPILLQHGII